eukprot:4251476-Pyramimonas_sp.AAC.1
MRAQARLILDGPAQRCNHVHPASHGGSCVTVRKDDSVGRPIVLEQLVERPSSQDMFAEQSHAEPRTRYCRVLGGVV